MALEQEYQFMADFTLPEVITEEFMNLIPTQRQRVNQLFRQRKLVSYALSLENGKMWAVFKGTCEFDVLELIRELPMAGFMSVQINILTFHDMTEPVSPTFSLN